MLRHERFNDDCWHDDGGDGGPAGVRTTTTGPGETLSGSCADSRSTCRSAFCSARGMSTSESEPCRRVYARGRIRLARVDDTATPMDGEASPTDVETDGACGRIVTWLARLSEARGPAGGWARVTMSTATIA